MVALPCVSVRVTFAALVRLRKKISFPSSVRSPITMTGIVWVVTPGAKVNVPFVAT